VINVEKNVLHTVDFWRLLTDSVTMVWATISSDEVSGVEGLVTG
jgi:hypothetical protein